MTNKTKAPAQADALPGQPVELPIISAELSEAMTDMYKALR